MELQDGMPNSEENPKNLENVQQEAEKQEEMTDDTESSSEITPEDESPGTTVVEEAATESTGEDIDDPEVAEQPTNTETEASLPVEEELAPTAPETETTDPSDSLVNEENKVEEPVDTIADPQEATSGSVALDENTIPESTGAEEELASTAPEIETTDASDSPVNEEIKVEEPVDTIADPQEATTASVTLDENTTSESAGVEDEVEQTSNQDQPETKESERTEKAETAEEVQEELEEIDFSEKTKAELLAFAIDLNNQDQIRKLDKYLKPLKSRFDKIFIEERQAALDAFVAEGNERDDFEFRGDEETKKFQDYHDLLREKRNKHYAEFEKRKEDNLKRKEEILEKIRELIDGEETDNSIKAVRELQNDWKTVGPVPGQHNKTLWANYNALLDRFYDARSIYFELKDLDRKKNLQLKLDLCAKAEALDEVESVKDAVIQLNELHEEFKHVGPIPRDQQEDIWQRFKSASDKIYVKRKGYVDDLKKAFVENLDKKMQLVEGVEQFIKFDSDRISAWNKKTKEIQELQKKWETVGGIPREKAKEVNKRFWAGFKGFFANKSAFFKRFEAQRGDNLKIKQGLVEEAKALQGNTDWVATTDKYKRLQARWKEVGPVPEKFRTSIYEEFKAACDQFFDQRRAQNQEQNQEQEANLKVKIQVCDSLEAITTESKLDLDIIYGLLDQFHEAGFVPRHSMKKVQNRFTDVTKKLMSIDALEEDDRQDLKINIEVGKIRGGPHADRKIFRKENSLKRKIDSLESDISTWKNNLEFFASSKAADQLKQDFEAKIVKATEQLGELKKELRMVRNS